MTDSQMIMLKNAIRRAHAAINGHPDTGSYYGEADRKFFAHQEVLSEPTPGRCHWLSFYGFSELGRKLYLNEDGGIREMYK